MTQGSPSHDPDVLIIGAGFAGLRAIVTMRDIGYRVTALEAGDDVGGVWFWNRYPGARCDVESYDYSYRFSEELEQEWRWSERYATQPEILSYINHVADRFKLRDHIYFNQTMSEATWNEDTQRWEVITVSGSRFSGRYLVMATGSLSAAKEVHLPGQEDFKGEIYWTSRWPRDGVDLTGKRVGVIGTGSSGMQMVPVIAPQVEHLTVFQRTPNYSIPAPNAPVSDEEDAAVKAMYPQRRQAARNSPSGLNFPASSVSALEVSDEEREAVFEEAWSRYGFGFVLCFRDLIIDPQANQYASDFIRRKIGEQINDPEVRRHLIPANFPFGTKRPSVDASYYPTFNRENVTLADLRDAPIERMTETGIETSEASYELDVVAFATGFDALSGSFLKPNIVGRDGLSLREHWSSGPLTYLGLCSAGFPNLFFIAGPGSPSLLSNVMISIEECFDWLSELLIYSDSAGNHVIEPTAEAEAGWVQHVNEKAAETLYPTVASYYNGDNVPGKPKVFMPYSGGVRGYRRILERVANNNYEGLVLSR